MLWYLLPAIVVLGVITSYEDMRYGWIRNKYVLYAIIYGFLVYAFQIGLLFYTGDVEGSYLIELSTNILFSIAVGFTLWHLKLWSAADGKLFIAFCVLIPLSAYHFGYQHYIPSVTYLLNTLLMGLVFLLFFLIRHSKSRHIRKVVRTTLREIFSPRSFFTSVLHLFVLSWAMTSVFPAAEGYYVIRYAATIGAMSLIQDRMSKTFLPILLIVAVLRLVYDPGVFSVAFVANFLVMLFTWRLLRQFLRGSANELGDEVFTEVLDAKYLRPGMSLAEHICTIPASLQQRYENKGYPVARVGKKYYIRKPKREKKTKHEGLYVEEEPEGLSKELVEQLHKLPFEYYKVCNMMAFAPFLFAGALLTIIFRGNILISIITLLQYLI